MHVVAGIGELPMRVRPAGISAVDRCIHQIEQQSTLVASVAQKVRVASAGELIRSRACLARPKQSATSATATSIDTP